MKGLTTTTAYSDPITDAIRYLADQLTSALEANAQEKQQSMQATMLEGMLATRDQEEPPLP